MFQRKRRENVNILLINFSGKTALHKLRPKIARPKHKINQNRYDEPDCTSCYNIPFFRTAFVSKMLILEACKARNVESHGKNLPSNLLSMFIFFQLFILNAFQLILWSIIFFLYLFFAWTWLKCVVRFICLTFHHAKFSFRSINFHANLKKLINSLTECGYQVQL